MMEKEQKIEWRSVQERLSCFDALVILAKRGCIASHFYHITMERIMGHGVFSHELGTTGLAELRKEIEGLPHMNPFEVLRQIREG